MRLPHRFVLVSTLVLAISSLGNAATVTGTVKGPDGSPFQGAFVQAVNAKTRESVSVLSDKQGRYHVDNLPAGEYQVRVRAIGFTADPRSAVNLTAGQNATFEFSLQKGTVKWSDLNMYQGKQLLPEGAGKDLLEANCFVCHGFQTRMASVHRDEEGYLDRVNYMRQAMAFQLNARFTEDKAKVVAAYLDSVFGTDATAPRSPADLPGYKDTVRPFSDEAMNIVYVEWDVAGSKGLPWSAAPDKDGNIWMPQYGRGNEVTKLDPKTGEIKRFVLPFDQTAGVHSAVPAPDGMVYFTEFALNKLGKLDPSTGKITEFPDDFTMDGGRRSDKHTVRVDGKGNLWSSGSPLSKYDPETGKYTHFNEVPSSYGITLDKNDNVWFVVLQKDGKLGRIDAKTEKVTQWSPPTQGTPQRLAIDSDGIVWFGERFGNKIGRFDPKTETFKEYPLPGPSASPYAIAVDKRGVWYASTDQDLLGRLDPITGKVVEYPFPHSEGMMREFFIDTQGRIWFATPPNNRVGYFYLAGENDRANK